MDEITPPVKTDKPERVLVPQDETVLSQHENEPWFYQDVNGSACLVQKSSGAGCHISGFLSELLGIMGISEDQLQAHLRAQDPETRARLLNAAKFHQAHVSDGHLRANVTMLIGARHRSDLHPSGYWTGDDVYLQLAHVITIFEITHPGKQGVFLFDNSTGHGKMPEDALLAEGLIKGPCGKVVTKLRDTTWVDANGVAHDQSFVFKEGDELLYEAKAVRANPLDDDGVVCFPVGEILEAQKPGREPKSNAYHRGVRVVSRQANNTYTLRYPAMDEDIAGVKVGCMQVPSATYRKGPVPPELVGHSKGSMQILLERGLIDEFSELKAKCGTTDKAKLKAKSKPEVLAEGKVSMCQHTVAGLMGSRAVSFFCYLNSRTSKSNATPSRSLCHREDTSVYSSPSSILN